MKNRHESKANDGSQGNDKSDYNNMKYDFSEDTKLREVLPKIINFDGISTEIVGCWIWVDGNTYGYKDALKEIGFKWAREKKKWYFHTETFRKNSRKTVPYFMAYNGRKQITANTREALVDKLLVIIYRGDCQRYYG